MRRVVASLLMAIGLVFTMVPGAQASHSRECHEITIHFRPAYCIDEHDGYTWVWVCPDYYAGCYLVIAPFAQ